MRENGHSTERKQQEQIEQGHLLITMYFPAGYGNRKRALLTNCVCEAQFGDLLLVAFLNREPLFDGS